MSHSIVTESRIHRSMVLQLMCTHVSACVFREHNIYSSHWEYVQLFWEKEKTTGWKSYVTSLRLCLGRQTMSHE